MKLFSKIIVCLLVLVAAYACKRNQKPIAGTNAVPSSSPTYEVAKLEVASYHGSTVVDGAMPTLGAAAEKTPEELYTQVCSACHQVTGQGIPGAFPPLDGSKYMTSDKVDRMAAIMVYGLVGPITVKGVEYNSAMAGLSSQSDEDLAKIATYVRAAWSNKAGEVKPETFKAVREKWGSRGPFNIEELGAEPS